MCLHTFALFRPEEIYKLTDSNEQHRTRRSELSSARSTDAYTFTCSLERSFILELRTYYLSLFFGCESPAFEDAFSNSHHKHLTSWRQRFYLGRLACLILNHWKPRSPVWNHWQTHCYFEVWKCPEIDTQHLLNHRFIITKRKRRKYIIRKNK